MTGDGALQEVTVGSSGWAVSLQEEETRPQKDVPKTEMPEGTTPADNLTLHFQPPDHEVTNFRCVSLWSVSSCYSSPSKPIQSRKGIRVREVEELT